MHIYRRKSCHCRQTASVGPPPNPISSSCANLLEEVRKPAGRLAICYRSAVLGSGRAFPVSQTMTTSAARTVSSVKGLGNSLEMSMPRSAMAAIAAALISCPGFGFARPGDGTVAGQSLRESERHLRPAGVLGAQERYGRLAVAMYAFHFGDSAQPLSGESFCPSAGGTC
jgi:hypothetical protein